MTRILKENGLKPDDWELVVGDSLFILRSRICEATGRSPHDMFFNFQTRKFATSNDLDSLEAPQIVKNRDLKRGSHVLIRNFVHHRKTDPFVKERRVVTDILSPQSAEDAVDGKSPEVINLRHLAPAPTPVKSPEEPSAPNENFTLKSPIVASEKIENKRNQQPHSSCYPVIEPVPASNTNDPASDIQVKTCAGRFGRKPNKLTLETDTLAFENGRLVMLCFVCLGL